MSRAASAPTPPQELVERALALSKADGCVVLAEESSEANLRWANNTLTTNGQMRSRRLTVVSTVGAGEGTAAGVLTRTNVGDDDVEAVVRASEEAARDAAPADDAQPLLDPGAAVGDDGWSDPPAETSIDVFSSFAPALGDAFDAARSGGRLLYGFAEHTLVSVFLGSSTGVRARYDQPTGKAEVTGKTSDVSRSTWVGQATRDFADVDVAALDAEVARRLGWAARRVDLDAGRYDTVLPPSAVADLLTYLYWTMVARDAHDGRTVFSRPGGGTKVGDRVADPRVQLWSDPAAEGLQCAPFVATSSSHAAASVFDNGMPVRRTDWIRDGELRALLQTRHSAQLTGLDVTPPVDNLLLDVGGATSSLEALVGEVQRGLLLTCLWYIRVVDPQTLLLTGLTRDGVFLVEGGEVVGEVNNFRFNESPFGMLGRVAGAASSQRTLAREFGDYFTRASMPALRIPDFNMSSVSQAS